MANKASIYTRRSIPAILVLVSLYVLPLSFIFLRAFENVAEALRDVFTSSYTYKLLWFSTKQAFISALVSVLLALPFAAFMSKYTFPGRKTILAISSLSFTMPTILAVLGFVIFSTGIGSSTLSAGPRISTGLTIGSGLVNSLVSD